MHANILLITHVERERERERGGGGGRERGRERRGERVGGKEEEREGGREGEREGGREMNAHSMHTNLRQYTCIYGDCRKSFHPCYIWLKN